MFCLLYCLPLLFKVLTEERFMLWLLYCLPLLFKVWQRSSSCCCYIVYHYSLRFDRGEVHVVVVILYTITVSFDRGVVHVLVVILSAITLLDLTKQWLVLLLYCLPLLFKVLQRNGLYCSGGYILYDYCLWFDRGVVRIVVVEFTV
jgi:hypothetical protein